MGATKLKDRRFKTFVCPHPPPTQERVHFFAHPILKGGSFNVCVHHPVSMAKTSHIHIKTTAIPFVQPPSFSMARVISAPPPPVLKG